MSHAILKENATLLTFQRDIDENRAENLTNNLFSTRQNLVILVLLLDR